MDYLVSSGGCPVAGSSMYVNVKPEDLRGPTFVECDPTNTFKKHYDSMEKERLQREAEHDRLLKLVDSYAKLVDRLEEQIESLTCKEAVECCNREDFVKKTDSDLLFKQKMEDQHDARLELSALYAKLQEITGLRYYWNKIDKRLGVDPNQRATSR